MHNVTIYHNPKCG
ncbi:MAG TPA: hypothetical protein DEB15_01215, partial [Pusillimonas sp.]|nr:hypothetical protein [Pusillimonas sp.]